MRLQITKNNIDVVALALAAFVAKKNRLPRPASDRNGDETKNTSLSESNYVGNVPFRSLGIQERFSLDGEGNPLIYIVESKLTLNFESIYERGLGKYFCSGVSPASITITGIDDPAPDVIAFVLDTKDNLPTISKIITVRISHNTFWVSRDMILMRYLKNCPCKTEIKQATTPDRNSIF
jgi:hypothetical protein